MKYYWIFKYILYSATTKKNFVAAYHEGAVLALLIISPFFSFIIFFGYINMIIVSIICALIIAIDWIITWDDDKVNAKYHYLDLNKWKLEKEFRIVRRCIFIDAGVLIFSLIYAGIKEVGWF